MARKSSYESKVRLYFLRAGGDAHDGSVIGGCHDGLLLDALLLEALLLLDELLLLDCIVEGDWC